MVTRQTKLQLANELAAARNENSVLRAQIEALRAENKELVARTSEYRNIIVKQDMHVAELQYPLTDFRGRKYRLELRAGREVKCFQP